jgi:hypothetical protein
MTRRVGRRCPYPTSFYIDLDTKNECKALAASMSISESSVVRMLIRQAYADKIGSRKPPQQAQEQVQA